MSLRKASHAGSWYTDDRRFSGFYFIFLNFNFILYLKANKLNKELSDWLNKAQYTHGPAKAIISP